MGILSKIRRMHYRDGLSFREITKRTGFSRNTICKWLREPKAVLAPKYVRKKTFSKLSPFHEEIEVRQHSLYGKTGTSWNNTFGWKPPRQL